MKINETLACKLSIMRKLYGKSLVEFVEEIDVSKTTLQNIEAGKANLTLNMVETIANRLGISPMALISDEYDARHLYTAKLFLEFLKSFRNLSMEDQTEAIILFDRLVRILSRIKVGE